MGCLAVLCVHVSVLAIMRLLIANLTNQGSSSSANWRQKYISPLINHLAIQVGWSSINRPRQSSWHWKSVIFLTPLSISFKPLFAFMYSMVLGNPFPISKFTWHQHVSVPETCHISSRFSFVFLKKFETRLPCHWKAKFKVLLAPAFSFMQPGLVVDSKRWV